MALSPSATALPISDERGNGAAPDVPMWRLTQAIQLLRLTVSDASLRAREEAQRLDRETVGYWFALGRAHGYQEAAYALRGWTHPEQHDVVLHRLEQRLRAATANHDRDATGTANPRPMRAYHSARAWAVRWVIAQAGELDAHALAWS